MSENDNATPEVEVQTEAAPIETPESAAPPTEDKADSEAETKEPESKPEKTFTQKELDDILTRRLAKEQRKIEKYARAEAEAQMLREQLAKLQQPEQKVSPSGEPKPEQFTTYEEYLDKLTDWKLDQREAKRQEQQAQQRQIEASKTQEERIRETLSKAAEKYDDFEEVIGSIPAQYVTPAMVDAIGESEIGGEISYYLGNNHKEAAEIARMTPVQQVKAIDRLEAKLKAPAKVSAAPAPAQVVGKGKATQQLDLASASLDEYMKIRQKQGARWANP